jgi:2-oxoacid:acceptor oxidoreductase gamma subunit (pyruvate/2-ketoisovalerate family)
MIQIILHGRGGQGAVTAADVLATAAFLEGKYAQSFPSFAAERRGAPVIAFARIADERFVDRSRIVKADYVIVLDPSLLKTARPLIGVKENGCAILNIDRPPEEIQKETGAAAIRIVCVDASAISEEIYGKRPLPMVNMAMLGAFVAVSGSIKIESVMLGIDKYFSGSKAEDAKRSAAMTRTKMEAARTSWQQI